MQSSGRIFDLDRSRTFINRLIDRVALRSRLSRRWPLRLLRGRSRRTHTRVAIASAQPAIDSLAARLRTDGAATLDPPQFEALLSPRGVASVRGLVRDFAHYPLREGVILESEDIVHAFPEAFHLGLEPLLIRAAEAYLGEPCFYIGCSMKREACDGAVRRARLWHRDVEDDRMLRIIIYLNEVREGGGAFEYADAPSSARAAATMGYRSGYLPDDRIAETIGSEHRHAVQGPAGSVVLFDGIACFHRIQLPTVSDRLSLSLSYTTRTPVHIMHAMRLRAATRRDLMTILEPSQRAYVPRARLL